MQIVKAALVAAIAVVALVVSLLPGLAEGSAGVLAFWVSHTGLVQPPKRNQEKGYGPYAQQQENGFQHDESSSARGKDTPGRNLVIKGQ